MCKCQCLTIPPCSNLPKLKHVNLRHPFSVSRHIKIKNCHPRCTHSLVPNCNNNNISVSRTAESHPTTERLRLRLVVRLSGHEMPAGYTTCRDFSEGCSFFINMCLYGFLCRRPFARRIRWLQRCFSVCERQFFKAHWK